jgi:hypothetical protein
LTVRQAIADIAEFVNDVLERQCRQTFELEQCRLIVVGVGTGGSLAAWFRQGYPQFSTGTWVVSAPVSAAFDIPSIDSVVGRRVRGIREDCATALRSVVGEVGPGLFNLTENASVVQVVSDVVERAVLNDTVLPDLQQFCNAGTESALAEFFGNALRKLGIASAGELDLWAEPVSRIAKDRRAALYLGCNEVGWFHTASGDGPRPAAINRSYYSRLCDKVFGLGDGPRVDEFNREFGGKSPVMTSVVWSNGRDDPWAAVQVPGTEIAGSTNESVFVAIGSASGEAVLWNNQSYTSWKEQIGQPISGWVNFDCSHCNRTYGECFLHKCVCEKDWGSVEGKSTKCDTRQVMYRDMLTVEVLATLTPTGLVLAIGFVTWCVLIRSKENPSPEGSGAESRGRWSGGRRPTVQI